MKPDNRKPPWLKVKAMGGTKFAEVSAQLNELGLDTICREANCPNRGECFSRGTATFLIMGPRCTRNCRFCDVKPGRPQPLDPDEPGNLAEASRRMNLKYVVVTSVTRDDLPDGGAGHFAATIFALRRAVPKCRVEVLTPDFKDRPEALGIVMAAKPDVFNHNIETVPSLYPTVRPGADYRRSLELLRRARVEYSGLTKSGLMLGVGEQPDELRAVFDDLAENGASILTMGQYLAPSKDHLPVIRYVSPDEFSSLAEVARTAGIKTVFSGPLVRSSYMADKVFSGS